MSLQFSSLLVLALLAGACGSQELLTEPVPTDLRISSKIDSIITVDHQDHFSQVSPAGEGPKGALIRWNLTYSPPSKSFETWTYNQQNQVVGTFGYNDGYGQQIVRQAQYWGGYLASVWIAYLQSPPRDFPRSQAYLESLKKDLINVRPGGLVKYQYDKGGQVARELSYSRISGTNSFELTDLTDYEHTYDSAGQLQQTKKTTNSQGYINGSMYYWRDGDITREEVLYTVPHSNTPVIIKSYGYDKVVNPFAHSSFIAMYGLQSKHNRIIEVDTKGNVTSYVYTYQYDSEGRMVALLSGDGTKGYVGCTFVYAP